MIVVNSSHPNQFLQLQHYYHYLMELDRMDHYHSIQNRMAPHQFHHLKVGCHGASFHSATFDTVTSFFQFLHCGG